MNILVGKPLYFEEYRSEISSPLTWKIISGEIMDALRELEQQVILQTQKGKKG